MTRYTWLDFTRKDCTLVHPFHTVLSYSMNAYHLRLCLISYVCDHTYYKKYRLMLILYIYILVWSYTQRYFLKQSYKKNAKRPSYPFSPSTIIHTSLSTRQSFTGTRKHPSHYSQNIPRLHPISVWNPAPSTTPDGWGIAPIDALRNWKPKIQIAPEQKTMIQKRPTAMFLEDDGPTKGPTLKKI